MASTPIESTGSSTVSTREDTIALVAQAVDDNGATNTNLQGAKQWLEGELARAEESGIGNVELLQAAVESAEECSHYLSQAGAALEAFQGALEDLE
jgi:hypothetical protein